MPDQPLPDLRPDIPHAARIWNYWLGRTDNFAAARDAGRIGPIDAYCGVGRKP